MMRTLCCGTDRNNWNRAIDFEVQKIMGGDDLDEGPPAIIFQPFNLEYEAYDSKIAPIVVWGPWADQYEHRVQRGIEQVGWHGRCRLCRAWLVIEEFCPCNMYQHDHCQSVFLRPIQSDDNGNLPGIRVCFQCYQLLSYNTVVTITHDEGRVLVHSTWAGNLITSVDKKMLPATFEQFRHLVQGAARSINGDAGNNSISCLATDGYAYTKLQFCEYYGEHGEQMWAFAQMRTINTRLIFVHEASGKHGGLMTHADYGTLLHDNIQSQVEEFVYQLPYLHEYISPFLWPHEPVRLHGELFEEWGQLCVIPHKSKTNKKQMEVSTFAYRRSVAELGTAPMNIFYTVMARGRVAVALTNCFRQQSALCTQNLHNSATPVLSHFIKSHREHLLGQSNGYEIWHINDPEQIAMRSSARFPLYTNIVSDNEWEDEETFVLHFPWFGDVGTVDARGYPIM